MKIILLSILLLFPFLSNAQVKNDSIAHRIELSTSKSVNSNTTNCTIEKECIDEALTGKCIKYHNDQWFSYYSKKDQTVFINIYGQKCRDLKGIQLVVIDGVPCDTQDYNIVTCVSLATQDNFYTELKLKKNKEYLINIDGYLHDYCQFFIEIDTLSYGFPTYIDFPLKNKVTLIENRNTILNWYMPDSLGTEIKHFEIHKRDYQEFRFTYLNTVPVEGNAFGSFKENYSYTDTLDEFKKVFYKLIAVDNNDKKRLINEFAITKTLESTR